MPRCKNSSITNSFNISLFTSSLFNMSFNKATEPPSIIKYIGNIGIRKKSLSSWCVITVCLQLLFDHILSLLAINFISWLKIEICFLKSVFEISLKCGQDKVVVVSWYSLISMDGGLCYGISVSELFKALSTTLGQFLPVWVFDWAWFVNDSPRAAGLRRARGGTLASKPLLAPGR